MNGLSLGKRGFLVLLLIFAAGMLFASGETQPGTAQAVSGGKPTLQIGIQSNAFITDYDDNYLTRYLENLHNIELTFYLLPTSAAESRTKISLMAAAGDLPETIWGGGMTREQILELGSNGAFVVLNPYFADPAKTPEFNKIPQDVRTIMLRDTRSADGNNYTFAKYQPETWNLTPYRLYINRSWLTKLGLQEPKTTDDLRNVLIAFRDRDPNGNGQKDEIGITGFFTGGYGENVTVPLINAFVFWNPNVLSLDSTGNNVTAPFTEAGFRSALQYLNSLFKDGLLDASTFTADQQGFRALLNADPMVVGLTSMGSVGNYAGTDQNANYRAAAPILPPLSSPNSPGYTPYQDYVTEIGTFITQNAKNVDLAVKVMDSFYERDLTIINRFGEEGVDWTRDPDILAKNTNAYIEMGLQESLSLAQIRDVWTKPFAQHWQNAGPRYASLHLNSTFANLESPFNPDYPSSLHNAVNYQHLIPRHPEYVLPLLYYSADDGAALAPVITNVNEYVRQSIAEFTNGTRDINNDTAWNEYLRELDSLGLQQWIQIAQAAYNRQR